MARPWEALMRRYPARAVETDTGILSFRSTGAGPDIVLLHGIGSGSGSWVYQLATLSDTHRVTAWDAPGYGGSAEPESAWPGAADYAEPLRTLFDARGIRCAVVVGHSLGALIAARFAVMHPERVSALVLADPAAGHGLRSEAEREERLASRLERFDRLGAERHAEEHAPALLSRDATAEQVALVRWNMARLRQSGYRKAARLLASGDITADLRRVSVPATVLYGSEDTVTPPERCRSLAAAMPQPCPCRELAGAGHASHVEAADEFSAAVRDISAVVS